MVPIWPPKCGARGAPLSYANRPWGVPRRSCDRLGSVVFSSCGLGSLFWLSWGRLGTLLAPFWAVLGSLGVFLGHSERNFGAFNFFLISCSFILLSALGSLPMARQRSPSRRTERCVIRIRRFPLRAHRRVGSQLYCYYCHNAVRTGCAHSAMKLPDLRPKFASVCVCVCVRAKTTKIDIHIDVGIRTS